MTDNKSLRQLAAEYGVFHERVRKLKLLGVDVLSRDEVSKHIHIKTALPVSNGAKIIAAAGSQAEGLEAAISRLKAAEVTAHAVHKSEESPALSVFEKYDSFAKLTITGLSVQSVADFVLNEDLAGNDIDDVAKAFGKLNRSLQFGIIAGD